MKIKSLIYILLCVCLAGCASSSEVSKSKKEKLDELPKPETYEEWQYMGFGEKLPSWIDAAIAGNVIEVKKLDKELADRSIQIVKATGINPDQAEKRVYKAIEGNVSLKMNNYKVYKSLWVKINPEYQVLDEPYYCIKIMRREQPENGDEK